jgi:nitrogenase molybdenum-iron protein alpha/beta subunit
MNARSLDSREKDEGFWQEQEARLRGQLGQPCCTLSGMGSVLASMRGRFAVVIHGERDCANCFQHRGPGVVNFFCSSLTEEEFTSGKTQDSLRRCLELVVKEHSPQVVLVLGTCLVEMIGDRFEMIVDQMAESSGVPMVALHTSGLALGTQAEMLDWLFETLASIPQIKSTDRKWYRKAVDLGPQLFYDEEERNIDASRRLFELCTALEVPKPVDRSRSLNLIGMPRAGVLQKEPASILEAAGLEVNGAYPFDATLNDWRTIGRAAASFVADRSLYPRLVKRLEEYGQQVLDVPLPVGLENTTEFYRIIGTAFSVEKQLDQAMSGPFEGLQRQIDAFRRRRGGTRMAVGIRMLNNYRADQLAYEGLGDINALREMGFEIKLFIQGPPEEESQKQFASSLKQLGCHLPFEVFPDPWSLGERLRGAGFEVAYLADHSREEARKAGVPMITSRGLAPFFEGIPSNLILIERLLSRSLLEEK